MEDSMKAQRIHNLALAWDGGGGRAQKTSQKRSLNDE